jgi:hypothetical protein
LPVVRKRCALFPAILIAWTGNNTARAIAPVTPAMG